MTLAAAPSPADLRRLATERQVKRFGRIIDPALLPESERAKAEPLHTGSRALAFSIPGPKGELYALAAQTDPSMSAPIWARREGDSLYLVIHTPPRTKKNHTHLGLRQSKAYKRYEQEVVGAVAAVERALALPLPLKPYNIAIRYYVDRYGQTADRPGLDNGLFDALQNAGVIADDWYFRSTEGTPPPIPARADGEWPPRVEVTITPLPPSNDG